MEKEKWYQRFDWSKLNPFGWLNLTANNRSTPATILLISFLGGALLLYTGTRTIRLIDMTLPDDEKIQGYAALFALDVGLIFWVFAFNHTLRGTWQHAISGFMIIISLLGVIAAMITDTWVQASLKGVTGKISEETASNAIWAVTIVIALNVAAVVGMHLAHSEEAGYEPAQQMPRQHITVSRPQPAPALPRQQEINPAIAELKESESRPGHFANEVVASPFLPTMAMPKNRNGKKP